MPKFQIQIAVEHPVLFLHDPSTEPTVPADTGAAIVTATDDCLCFWVQPYVDGDAHVIVSDEPCGEGVFCFSGALQTPGKIVALSDSHWFPYANIPVKDAVTPVEIWASDTEQPEWTWIKLPIDAY